MSVVVVSGPRCVSCAVQLTILILATWVLCSVAFFGLLGLANGDAQLRRDSDHARGMETGRHGRSIIVTLKSRRSAIWPSRLMAGSKSVDDVTQSSRSDTK